MPESFTTRQLAVIASANKTIAWLFRVEDNLGNIYYWSTGTQTSGTGAIDIGAFPSPGAWTNGEWNYAHSFKIVNFSGISLRRSKSEYGIHAPNDVSFTIVNGSNTLTASNFKGGIVRIALVVDDGLGKQVIGSWRFVIKSASPYNQQIDVTCEDFLQQYLRGTYPNTRLISEIFPANTDNTIIKDNVCVPEVYGTAYIPLRSVYAGSARYYLLGPATDKTYTISEVRNPRATGAKITRASPAFAMTQSTQSTWRVFQPIISASTGGGAVDSPGLWENGDTFWDIPTKFSEVGTVSVTSPADVIRRVLLNMGAMDYDLNGASFDTARTTFTSWGLEWNFAFYYKEDRAKVLSKLLAMCHCCLVVGEQISLQVLSAASVKTLTAVEVTKPDETGPSSFRYTDSLAEKVSDSGYVAWQQTGESQDLFLKAKVPAKSATDYPDSETIELPGVQDSQKIQKLGTLYYQRKLLKSADISANLKGTCLIVRPDDVVTVNYADFGGTYNVLTDEVTIKPDASMDIRAIKFSEVLDDWADLAPAAITVATDSTTNTYSPVYAGPDSPGSTNLPNALPGRLRIGQTTNYILLDPNSPLRISLYSSDVERMRFGNLNGFLDYVTNLYGQAIGDATNYLKYDPTNGLRISGAISAGTIDIGGADASSFHVDANGNMWLGAATFDIATNPFAVSSAGILRAVSGAIGGFTLAATTFTATNLTLDSGNQKITLGSGTDIAILDAADAAYRLAIGHSTYASAPFRVTKAGALTASSATITGSITATSGAIANFTVAPDSLTSTLIGFHSAGYSEGAELLLGHATLYASAKIGLKADGSGKLASGNISWDSSGNITSTGAWTSTHTITGGTIQTAAAGARSVLSSAGLAVYDATTQRAKIGSDGAGWLGASDIISWTSAGVVSIAGFGTTNSALSVVGGGNTTTISATGTNAFIAGTTGAPTVSISHAGVLTATGASISGTLTATTGTIGGFTLSATALYAGTIATRIQLDTTSGIHLGATAFADAPFKVSLAGALTATSATISGAVTATSGSVGSFTIGTYLYTGSKTAYNDANAGVHLGSDGIGIGNNVFTVSAAGALVATSATITGAITATSGTFTGTINATAGKFGTATNYWSVGATGLTAVSASTDVFINYGKTDFTNTDTGFILGYDFSASKAKFYVGDSTSYLNWDGAALTYTKGTLVETIIQMYTSVASLKTSATAGDGSVNSAGMVLTYEGLFGCGASQTATIAAANANVRILADGSAVFLGLVKGSYLYGSSLMTKGTYLSASCSAADATLNVGDTTDFPASGSASFIDSANDRDTFTYTGKTGTTLTGCSGVLAHTVSATNKPLVVPSVKGIYISDNTNEMRFWGNRGDGTIEELASIGITAISSDLAIGLFGTANSSRFGVYGVSSSNYGVFGKSTSSMGVYGSSSSGIGVMGNSSSNYGVRGVSSSGYGVCGESVSNYGVYGESLGTYAIYSNGTTYLGGNTDVLSTKYLGLGAAKGRLVFTDAATDTIDISNADFSVSGATTFTGLIKTIGGLHVGGTSDPGTDNLIVDGTSSIEGGITSSISTGALKIFRYYNPAIADDAYVDLPDSTEGWACVIFTDGATDGNGMYFVRPDAHVVAYQVGIANSDSDGDFCVFDNGTSVRVKNRKGHTVILSIIYWYG